MCIRSFFLFKQKTAYVRRISDGSSDVCSSDLTYWSEPMEITGAILVGFADRVGAASFAAVDPATGRNIGPDFHEAGAADVADAAALAERAFAAFSETAPEARAQSLDAIRSAEPTSELQSLMRTSSDVLRL